LRLQEIKRLTGGNMKVKVDRNELLKKLSDIQNIVEKRNTMPVLNNFLLLAENSGCNITATDLETALKEPIEMTVLEEGKMCILPRSFSRLSGRWTVI
jgi:DNA polymerase III subunit beta